MHRSLSRTAPAEPAIPSIHPDDVREIRYRFRQSQTEFASMIGVTVGTLQKWEEGKAHPDGPALALLRVASKNPKIVARALGH
ncbi:MAG: helix-turn-helix domain-containing protein [Thermoanaerobaculia bacterium]